MIFNIFCRRSTAFFFEVSLFLENRLFLDLPLFFEYVNMFDFDSGVMYLPDEVLPFDSVNSLLLLMS